MKPISRLQRLEARLSAGDNDDGNALRDLCGAALAMIAAGDITDWTGENAGRFLSPSTAAGLQEPRYSQAWDTLQGMGEVVKQFALATGWRSPSHPGDDWQAYRANSAAEMADVAQKILAREKMIGGDENETD